VWTGYMRIKMYSRFIDFLVNTFNGKIIKNTRIEKQIFIEYAGREFEYYFKVVYYASPNSVSSSYDENFLKAATKTNLSLITWHKTGDTIIGKTMDKIISKFRADGCNEISVMSISLFNNKKVYTNDEIKARHFLSDPEVVRIISEYDYHATPIYIKKGILTLRLDDLQPKGVFADPELLKKHLLNMSILANRLDSLS
jgi:hypothetical protein